MSDELKRRKRPNAFLLLCSDGGDPHAAYRIVRAIRHCYGGESKGQLTILIPGSCKSAATLLCIGATSLIVGNRGELGPLDVQVRNPGEAFGQNSGLDMIKAFTYVQQLTDTHFENNLVSMRKMGMGTKLAAEFSARLAVGLHAPILEQIDPLRLGEVQRQMEIANEYAVRLNRYDSILKDGTLSLRKLVSSYPAHGFVIDRAEARTIFNRVTGPDPDEEALCDWGASMLDWGGGDPFVWLWSEDATKTAAEPDASTATPSTAEVIPDDSDAPPPPEAV